MVTEALPRQSSDPLRAEVTGADLAEALAQLFRAHDAGRYEQAVEECVFIDTYQFPHLDPDDIEIAARSFVDGLLAKDRIEFEHLRGGDIDRDGLAKADYRPVRAQLRTRASVIGADHRYASEKATAWQRHKVGGDYWTPFMRSQLYELRAILRDPDYPAKPRAGQSGFGPEPVRYILAFELHDMKSDGHWREGVAVMAPYFDKILEAHDESD